MVTKKITSNKIVSYLHHEISLDELLLWVEDTLMNSNYEKDTTNSLRDVIAKLGLAIVKSFGLDWDTCENLMKHLGYKLEVKALEVA